MILLFLTTSCMVVSPKQRHDNGKHKGWFKKSKHRPKKPKKDKHRISQINGQQADKLFTVADYFNWTKENALIKGQTEKPTE